MATPAGVGPREEKLQKMVADLEARLAAAEAEHKTVRWAVGRLRRLLDSCRLAAPLSFAVSTCGIQAQPD